VTLVADFLAADFPEPVRRKREVCAHAGDV